MSSCMRLSTARPARTQIWLPRGQMPLAFTRTLHFDGRARLSNEWTPSGGIAASDNEDAHGKLMRAGFLRQSHSGVFQLLPLGLRVQDKIIRLVDRHMRRLGASRVQLSAISPQALWEESGRLDKIGSELFRFQDRKGGNYLLGPTYEEEITTLVGRSIKSYKSLPLRLYQITQKYRDELRPRHGLLRGRDFCMKDLYTFDYNAITALETYEAVRKAYSQLFIDDMKLPILVARASSGDMGGSLSHEYHIPTPLGEDDVVSCDSCDYAANEEVALGRMREPPSTGDPDEKLRVWRGISKDRKTFINVFYYPKEEVNTHAVKKFVPDLDPGIEDAVSLWSTALTTSLLKMKLVTFFDRTVPMLVRYEIMSNKNLLMPAELHEYRGRIIHRRGLRVPDGMSFLRIKDGELCPQCKGGKLTVQKAIELGHTFYLGTRYSEPINAFVTGPKRLLLEGVPISKTQPRLASLGGQMVAAGLAPDEPPVNENTHVHLQMGCHGIGISRIIGAVANHLVDERGLNWPRVIAPYEVVVMYSTKDKAMAADAVMVYDALSPQSQPQPHPQIDAIIDDRDQVSLGWKLQDGDLVGYPVIVVIGKEWKASKRVEVQCRRLGFKELVTVEELRARVEDLLQKL